MDKNKIKERENELLDLVRIFCSQKLIKNTFFYVKNSSKRWAEKEIFPLKAVN